MSAVRTSRGHWWLFVLYGVIAILFGIYTFVHPLGSALALAWAFGVMALADGFTTIAALFNKSVQISKGWLVLYAVVSIVFGLLAIIHPAAVVSALLLLLGIWLIVAGVFRIIYAIQVRKQIDNEWLIGLSGVLAIILGILFLANPAASLFTLMLWIGAAVLVYGVFQIMAGWRLRRLPAVA
jgi:uncharacterized membrane protein HdeD (DUF308 family)